MFFALEWKKREINNKYCICFECDKKLNTSTYINNSCVYSHILSKKTFKEYAFEEWNLKIVCPSCHSLYTLYPKKAKKQYAEYNKLLDLHYKNELKEKYDKTKSI